MARRNVYLAQLDPEAAATPVSESSESRLRQRIQSAAIVAGCVGLATIVLPTILVWIFGTITVRYAINVAIVAPSLALLVFSGLAGWWSFEFGHRPEKEEREDRSRWLRTISLPEEPEPEPEPEKRTGAEMRVDRIAKQILQRHYAKQSTSRAECEKAGIAQGEWNFVNLFWHPLGWKKEGGKKLCDLPETFLEAWDIWNARVNQHDDGSWWVHGAGKGTKAGVRVDL